MFAFISASRIWVLPKARPPTPGPPSLWAPWPTRSSGSCAREAMPTRTSHPSSSFSVKKRDSEWTLTAHQPSLRNLTRFFMYKSHLLKNTYNVYSRKKVLCHIFNHMVYQLYTREDRVQSRHTTCSGQDTVI